MLCSSSRRLVQFSISSFNLGGKKISLEGVVLPKITSILPSNPVTFNPKWKHLSHIPLVNPDFRTPGNIDLLLGADVFCRVVHHGQRYGPSGTPSALQTCFEWVIAGTVCTMGLSRQHTGTCCVVTLTSDNLLGLVPRRSCP